MIHPIDDDDEQRNVNDRESLRVDEKRGRESGKETQPDNRSERASIFLTRNVLRSFSRLTREKMMKKEEREEEKSLVMSMIL